ncbi:hypothetical protein GW916_14610 [bacterium]|nr:hypothetical protein [bacterium]
MKSYLRCLAGAVVFSAAWFLFCFLCTVNWQVSLSLSLLNLVLWPWLVPLAFFGLCILTRRIESQSWEQVPDLKNEVLARILKGNEIPISLWVFHDSSKEFSLYPLTVPSFSGPRQVVVVSHSWLENSNAEALRAEFNWVLQRLDSNFKSKGYLRLFQMAFWFGQIFWLELSMVLLHYVMRIFGFEDLPRPAFWGQRLAWSVKRRWFGEEDGPTHGSLGLQGPSLRVTDDPTSWNYLSLGVWGYYSSRAMHPAWRFLMDAESLIPG